MDILIGVAGWSYPDWEGVVYPRPKPRGFDQLRFLSEFIDLIEINSTYYHPGSAKNAESWARRVADRPGFKFSVKLWRRFTHEPGPADAGEVKAARLALEILQEAGVLGAVLVQFPWSFKNTEDGRQRLNEVLEPFADFPLAVEVRHGSWDRPEFFERLRERGVSFVNVDQPVIGDSLAPSSAVTSRTGYVRLHGRNYENWFKEDAGRDDRYNYLYSDRELREWKQRIEAMEGDCDRLLVVTNNHYKGQALRNALEIKALFAGRVKVPEPLLRSYPELEAIADREGGLF